MMIDAKSIRTAIEAMEHPENLKTVIKTVLDSHDELERKLKIAEDALSFYAEQETWMQKEVNGGELMSRADIFGGTVAFKALKQIRGEE